MRPLKIALLSRWYAEENRRYDEFGPVQQLTEAVAALGHEVVVLSQSKSVTALEKSRIGALETWLSPREKRRGGWTGLRDKLAKRRFGHRKVHSDALDLRDFLAARGPFDVLWTQCEEPDGLVAAIAEGHGVALPPTATQICALRYDFTPAGPVFTGQAALRAAFTQAARIFANSEMVAQQMEAYAGAGLTAGQLRGKTAVIYPNLQAEFLQAAQADGPPAEPNRILFLGALNAKKGALEFLEAALLLDRSSGVAFAMAGGVTTTDAVFDRAWEEKLYAARAGGCRVDLLGKIPSADLITQIHRASVVVVPSRFDEFCRALAEPLALGRPVVTTDAVGAAVFVRNSGAGVIVPPGDAPALAQGIRQVLGDLAAFTENARACAPRLAHELSPQTIALQTVRHLQEMAG
jgi:glycosyltransferase involved in cell wall biosynthesis